MREQEKDLSWLPFISGEHCPSSWNKGSWEEVQVEPAVIQVAAPLGGPLERGDGQPVPLPGSLTLPGAKSLRPWMVSLSTGWILL